MIIEVRSSIPTFKTAKFDEGMNVVLADTAADSDETESTNGLGKTTLIRIIHFCLGGSSSKDKVLSHPDLYGTSFGITIIYNNGEIQIDRKTGEARVSVTRSFVEESPVEILAIEGSRAIISEESWKLLLSIRLVPDARAPGAEIFYPTFREIFIYLARLGKVAYADPQLAFQGQPGPSKRLTLSYLLGLNWERQRVLQEEIRRKEQIDAAIKALDDASSSMNEQTIGELDAERVVLETQITKKRDEVANFNVRDDYRSLELRLNDLDRDIHDLINENHSDARLLEYYSRSANEMTGATPEAPLEILRSAGALFKEEALRSLKEITAFHQQVYNNRSDFLKAEVSRLKAEIASRREHIDDLSRDKTDLLRLLKSSGALETLIDLQRGLTELEASYVALRARIEERKRFDRSKDDISGSIIKARGVLKRDLEDRRKIIDEVVGLFAEYTRALYGVSGRLGIDVKSTGYSLSFSINREGSDGVDQMVVFCFDLAVATVRARRDAKFRVLIHDSSMFADVDPRQYGLALQLAANVSALERFQYICCLNAGALPHAHMGEFDLEKVIKLRLSDKDDSGRLLGRKLPPREKK